MNSRVRLAIAAMAVLAVRRMAELGFEYTARASAACSAAVLARLRAGRDLACCGERFVLIALTAVLFGPRVTLLLCWGVVATGWILAGQIAGSAAAIEPVAEPDGGLSAYRGDGVISRWIGGLVQGRLPPLPPVLVGLFVTCVLAGLGLPATYRGSCLTPVEAMLLLASLGSRHPHDGRADWLVPALLVGERVFLAALGFSRRVPAPWVFALLAAVIVRHADLLYRARSGRGIPADRFGLGWDGRMLLLPGWPPSSVSRRSPTRWFPDIFGCFSAGISSADGCAHGWRLPVAREHLIGMVLAAARAAGCARTRTSCPRPCCRSTARSPSSTSRCATWLRWGCATS